MLSSKALRLTAGAAICLALCILDGCAGARSIYLGDDTTRTVRLRETIKGAKVWVKDSTGTAVPAVMDLPEGGFFRNNLD